MRGLLVVALVHLMMFDQAFAQQLTPADIVKRLDPATAVAPRPTLRSDPWSSPSPNLRGAGEEEATAAPSVNLHVPFEYNSDKLTGDGILILRNLGAALKDPKLAKYRFKIAGHTDAKGTAGYNLALSERRAGAVRDYLIFQYDLSPDVLETIGYGSTQLMDAARPEDGINRRVQVVNIGTK